MYVDKMHIHAPHMTDAQIETLKTLSFTSLKCVPKCSADRVQEVTVEGCDETSPYLHHIHPDGRYITESLDEYGEGWECYDNHGNVVEYGDWDNVPPRSQSQEEEANELLHYCSDGEIDLNSGSYQLNWIADTEESVELGHFDEETGYEVLGSFPVKGLRQMVEAIHNAMED